MQIILKIYTKWFEIKWNFVYVKQLVNKSKCVILKMATYKGRE